MTRNIITSSNYYEPNTFGGYIYLSDFETDYKGKNQEESSIAKRIASDWRFDNTCRVQTENKIRQAAYKKGMNSWKKD